MKKIWMILAALTVVLFACKQKLPDDPTPQPEPEPHPVVSDDLVRMPDTIGWAYVEDPGTIEPAQFQVSTDTFPLHFFGWSKEEDFAFTVNFPGSTDGYHRATLDYVMTSSGSKGAGEWDMTTQVYVQDPTSGEWYELVRAITPYGKGKNFYNTESGRWARHYTFDISEFLPILQGTVNFRMAYWGWDATEEYAHAMKMNFHFYTEGGYGKPTFHQKLYDTSDDLDNPGQNGYRAWAYGVNGYSIEDDSRLGKRLIHIPAGTDYCVLRVCFSGHGQDAVSTHKETTIVGEDTITKSVKCGRGTYPDRPGYTTVNSAEFDYNRYQVVINGDTLGSTWVWEINKNNSYKQYGTYSYNRCGWGPGKPCNVHHWVLKNIPAEGADIVLDLDLDRFISNCTSPRCAYVPCFYIATDIHGFSGPVPAVSDSIQ